MYYFVCVLLLDKMKQQPSNVCSLSTFEIPLATPIQNVVFQCSQFTTTVVLYVLLQLSNTRVRMPSASAKVERVASLPEAADPVKLILSMVEKRIRNLEKRMAKLEHYRMDVKNGKELNEDQKMAVSKYDEVVAVLEHTREMYKSIQSMVVESSRHQKKWAKKEQLERQQQEIQRMQRGLLFSHYLSCFQNEDVRSDFLNGENGAVQLASEQLSQLDQLHKLIGPGLPSEQADLPNHFHVLAENYIFLVEGKNKEIVGSTYKVLKDLLENIENSGYFSRPSGPAEEDGISSDDMPEDEAVSEKAELPNQEDLLEVEAEILQQPDIDENSEVQQDETPCPVPVEEITCNEVPPIQNGPLQEVLSSQGAFNFLQESQIDLDAPHMDPAVVAVHQMAPPPTVNFAGNTYPASAPVEDKPVVNGPENCDVSTQPPPVSQVPVVPATVPRTVAPVLSSVQLNSQQEFDPSHPIPTQTFTNQSFAVMQNMIMPQGYVPVTMHHAPMPPHMAPIAVVPGLSPPVTTGASVVPVHVPVTPVPVTPAAVDSTPSEVEPKNSEADDDEKLPEENIPSAESETNSNNASNERNGENGYTNSYRGGYRRGGRGRGNNGYFRGRPNYNGRGGGGFQNHYYQDRNGYNGNYRRGNNRGGPRGNGNNRGRGNYRTQQGSSAQQQQQQQQQTQQ